MLGKRSVLALSCIAFPLGLMLGKASEAQEIPSDSAPIPNEAVPDDVLAPEEALVLDGKSYAARFNVSLDEAMRRILIISGTNDEIAALDQELGDEMAGVYFDNGQNFGLKVNVTGQRTRPSRRIERRASGEGRRAARATERAGRQSVLQTNRRTIRQRLRISDAEVARAEQALDSDASVAVDFVPGARQGRRQVRQAITTNLDRVAQIVPTLEGVAYDERRGTVVVQLVGNESTLTAEMRATIQPLFQVPVEYQYLARELTPTQAQVTAVRGGTQIVTANGQPTCTTAFVGFDPQDNPGVFTAAHCWAIPQQTLWYEINGRRQQLTRDLNLSLYTTSEDIVFLRFPAGVNGLPQFFANRNEAARVLAGRRTLGTTNVRSGTAQGSWICFFGMTSSPSNGQGCGEVRFKEFAASPEKSRGAMTRSTGVSYYVQVQGPTSGFRCGPGDSGGPWFSFNVAWGIMSSCEENVVNGNESSANYTSFDAAYARRYRLAY